MQRSSAPDQPLSSESDEALPGGRVAPGNAVRRHRSARQQRPASMRDHHAATLPTTTPRISHESGKLTLDFVDHPALGPTLWGARAAHLRGSIDREKNAVTGGEHSHSAREVRRVLRPPNEQLLFTLTEELPVSYTHLT